VVATAHTGIDVFDVHLSCGVVSENSRGVDVLMYWTSPVQMTERNR